MFEEAVSAAANIHHFISASPRVRKFGWQKPQMNREGSRHLACTIRMSDVGTWRKQRLVGDSPTRTKRHGALPNSPLNQAAVQSEKDQSAVSRTQSSPLLLQPQDGQ